MNDKKEPHEELAHNELDTKAAQEVHYQDDFNKADKAGKNQKNQDQDQEENKSEDK